LRGFQEGWEKKTGIEWMPNPASSRAEPARWMIAHDGIRFVGRRPRSFLVCYSSVSNVGERSDDSKSRDLNVLQFNECDQKGNNRQACFAGEPDMKAYLSWLMEYSQKHEVDMHAWVLMSNHWGACMSDILISPISTAVRFGGRAI
jgi:hypothetical protein